MSNIIVTRDGKRFVKKSKSMLITPYVYDVTDAKYYLGANTYDIFAIVGDTIVISQADGQSDSLNNEFSSIPVIENVTLGKWSFSADCLDMQNIVLKELFSAKVAYSGTTEVDGAIALPNDFKTVYCCIQVSFEDDDTSIIVLPKVLLSSSVNVSTIHTDVARNKIKGTPLLTEVCVLDDTSSVLNFSDGIESSYTPRTPFLFVPTNRDFGVLHHKSTTGNKLTYMSLYDAGTIVGINTSDGNIEDTLS